MIMLTRSSESISNPSRYTGSLEAMRLYGEQINKVLFLMIYHQTVFRLMLNQSEKGNNNPNLV